MGILRPFDPPVEADQRVGLAAIPGAAAGFAVPTTRAEGVLEVCGHYNACDVWAQLPDATWDDVLFQIWCEGDAFTQILDRRAATPDAEAPFVANDGTRTVLLFSIRGRACNRFRVQAFPTNVEHAPARFYARAWGESERYGDRAGRPIADTHSYPHQQVICPVTDVPAGGGAVDLLWTPQNRPVAFAGGEAFNPTGGRTNVTGVLVSNSDAAAAAVVTISSLNLAGVPTQFGRMVVGAGRQESLPLVSRQPLRGQRGGKWQAQCLAGPAAGTVKLSATGYQD